MYRKKNQDDTPIWLQIVFMFAIVGIVIALLS